MCAAIKQTKRVKLLWYGGRWSKYKYGEAWQVDYITLPQTRQGRRDVLTMVEATTGWLETYPVPHATAHNTILGLEKQVLWRHGTPERIESDYGTHFTNSLINNWAREHGIEWVYHIPYHAPASGKVERYNGLLKTTLKALGGGSFKNWEQHLAKATWLVNTRGSTNRAGPAQSESLHIVDGEKVPVVHLIVSYQGEKCPIKDGTLVYIYFYYSTVHPLPAMISSAIVRKKIFKLNAKKPSKLSHKLDRSNDPFATSQKFHCVADLFRYKVSVFQSTGISPDGHKCSNIMDSDLASTLASFIRTLGCISSGLIDACAPRFLRSLVVVTMVEILKDLVGLFFFLVPESRFSGGRIDYLLGQLEFCFPKMCPAVGVTEQSSNSFTCVWHNPKLGTTLDPEIIQYISRSTGALSLVGSVPVAHLSKQEVRKLSSTHSRKPPRLPPLYCVEYPVDIWQVGASNKTILKYLTVEFILVVWPVRDSHQRICLVGLSRDFHSYTLNLIVTVLKLYTL
ncbi:hypothetical protein DUI87_05075 [Hirundo rustica rustica]|uniref:Integrase catalytic domain-containing protein n=1 Tax=Hirundo rustica rustica TaxID=333673 RepID=A0A3M0L320_HIRRU|nr:hypothetical protein DUI87_05075 [Hirundo rustica rustica]